MFTQVVAATEEQTNNLTNCSIGNIACAQYALLFCYILLVSDIYGTLYLVKQKKKQKKMKTRLMHPYCICKKQIRCHCRFLTARPAYVK